MLTEEACVKITTPKLEKMRTGIGRLIEKRKAKNHAALIAAEKAKGQRS